MSNNGCVDIPRHAVDAPWIAVATTDEVESDDTAAVALILFTTCFFSIDAASGVRLWLSDSFNTSTNSPASGILSSL